ncbi:PhoPQ-activated protein PqaA family protein [Chryseolinea sp. H1M3-3]|uniref:PhoPQ-activated pathogenicity-related family protein n=1 Tax=Chryseolinea sp. H1M3-3 TaxID=3034144 RepID=UPI0023EBE65C|nr:PhoPQ-activated protein PqaA family protein [Chryseolinea sp. H1M3-3]
MTRRFICMITVLLQFIFLSHIHAQSALTPETALHGYLNNGDKAYHWELKETYTVGDAKAYSLLLTSQQWHEYIWTHQLTILVPAENEYDGALLFITGGSNKKGLPNWNSKDDKFLQALGSVATKNKSIVALLRQTPNQPLHGDLTEDALISYTLHKFKEDGDYSWPLLFPMVKSAVRAMDAVQEFAKNTLQHEVKRFVVSGASKRGWTTWLTGASDSRVVAIAPMVIDILNMPVNLDYQVKMWKDYSVQIEDYVKLGIPQTATSEKGQAITTMVDPYSYRKKLTMPKMLIMGTNDEYWTVDAIKHYIDSIPGQNFVHYVPNVGHDLGDKKQALAALSAFFGATVANKPYPVCQPDLTYGKKGITLKVKATPDVLVDAILWSTSSTDTDFRDEKWEGKSLGLKKKSAVITSVQPYPASGYRAFYLDLKYKDSNGGEYTKSTRMYVADNDEVFVK